MYQGKLQEFEGQLLSVKTIAGMVHLAPSTLYKYLNQGFTIYDAIEEGKRKSDKVFKNREKTNNQEAKKYLWKGREWTVAQLAAENGISREPLYRRLKKGMSVEQAIEDIKKHISKKYPFLGSLVSIYRISLLTGVSEFYLEKALGEEREYTEAEVNEIVSHYQKPNIIMVGNVSLVKYCIDQQLNYNVIYYLMKTYQLTPLKAIQQYRENGQTNHFSYTFTIGDILLSHFFIKERLDDRYIKDRMRKGESEIEAITACIFLSKEDYKTREVRNSLYHLYQEEGIEAVNHVGLEEADQAFIRMKAKRVEEVLFDYRLYEAIQLLPTARTTEERTYILNSLHLTQEDVTTHHEELFEDFIPSGRDDEVTHIWKKKF